MSRYGASRSGEARGLNARRSPSYARRNLAPLAAAPLFGALVSGCVPEVDRARTPFDATENLRQNGGRPAEPIRQPPRLVNETEGRASQSIVSTDPSAGEHAEDEAAIAALVTALCKRMEPA